MKIRALLERDQANQDSNYYWRVILPFKTLQQNCIDAEYIYAGDDIPEDTDILVIPKMWVRLEDKQDAERFFEEVRDNGTLLVYDSDDDIWSESFTQYMTKLQWNPDKGKELLVALIDELEARREAALWTLMQCDAVTVSSKVLAEYISLISEKPVFVVNNAIDVSGFEERLAEQNLLIHPHYKTIGWSGGSRPLQELQPMLEAWNHVAKRDDVKFVIAGWMPNLSSFSNLTSDKLLHLPWTSIEEYPQNLQVDIGCVCVGDDDFSKRKTVIKAWEYALAGALVIGSESLYSGEPIAHCSNVKSWVNALEFYLNHEEAREAFAVSYRTFVCGQYDMKYNWLYWMDAYSKILNTLGNKNVRDKEVALS
jgi:hypothetical protein